MSHPTMTRVPPIIIPPLIPSPTDPSTLIFLHDYDSAASRYNRTPPNNQSLAHHLHISPHLHHLKIIIPNALPCIHPTVKRNVWYNLDVAIPPPAEAHRAHDEIENGSTERNENDMKVSMDYVEELINTEIASGTPANRIVLMGYSQGATLVTLFLLTRKLGADLGGVISYAGFAPVPMSSVPKIQKESGLEGRWSKDTVLFLLHGKKDVFVLVEIYYAWLERLRGFAEAGQGIKRVEGTVIEGIGHFSFEGVWPTAREILERIVPAGSGKVSAKL